MEEQNRSERNKMDEIREEKTGRTSGYTTSNVINTVVYIERYTDLPGNG